MSKKIKELISTLKVKEELEILHTIAFMAYNPSIGRVLQPKGVKKFSNIAEKIIEDAIQIKDIESFDKLHKDWLILFKNRIKTNGEKMNKCTYGQAQKAINVFLKVYFDWGKYRFSNKKIKTFLHVPLDSNVLSYFKKNFKDVVAFQNVVEITTKYHKLSNHSLSQIKKYNEYFAWQQFFRELYPKKPVLFDIVWALERLNK